MNTEILTMDELLNVMQKIVDKTLFGLLEKAEHILKISILVVALIIGKI